VYDCIIYVLYYILVCGVSNVRPNEVLTGQSVVPEFSACRFDRFVEKIICKAPEMTALSGS